jgi:hypothetical protein
MGELRLQESPPRCEGVFGIDGQSDVLPITTPTSGFSFSFRFHIRASASLLTTGPHAGSQSVDG